MEQGFYTGFRHTHFGTPRYLEMLRAKELKEPVVGPNGQRYIITERETYPAQDHPSGGGETTPGMGVDFFLEMLDNNA